MTMINKYIFYALNTNKLDPKHETYDSTYECATYL